MCCSYDAMTYKGIQNDCQHDNCPMSLIKTTISHHTTIANKKKHQPKTNTTHEKTKY